MLLQRHRSESNRRIGDLQFYASPAEDRRNSGDVQRRTLATALNRAPAAPVAAPESRFSLAAYYTLRIVLPALLVGGFSVAVEWGS
jgi:hypothetical protein